LRYPLVGGTRQRRFDGTSLKPCKLLENAQTPTSRVHAVLGGITESIERILLLQVSRLSQQPGTCLPQTTKGSQSFEIDFVPLVQGCISRLQLALSMQSQMTELDYPEIDNPNVLTQGS